MEPAVSHDDEFLPPTKLPKRSSLLLWLAVAVVLVVIVILGVKMLQAEEKLVVCAEPYITGDECANTCNGECRAALFANNKPVCFDCIEQEEKILLKEDACPEGLTDNKSTCDSSCNNGSCIEFNKVQDKSCYICVQCATGTYGSKDECDAACGTECTVSGEKKGAKCYSCT